MALPNEKQSEYPEAYLSKVPNKIRRREKRWSESATHDSTTLRLQLLDVSPSFIIHEDDLLYFDYGAVKFGRKPQLDGLHGVKVVCVGMGWLPDWEFTINPCGLPSIAPADALFAASLSDAKDSTDGSEPGVLGFLYKLVIDDTSRWTRRSLFSKKTNVAAKDILCATQESWNAAVPFHSNLKVLQQVELYIHVLDGKIGHKYQKEGGVIPFRTPEWPVKAVVHVDPPRQPIIQGELRVDHGKLQGEWVAKDLNKWIKDVKLPSPYVDQWLREWISGDPRAGAVCKKNRSKDSIRTFLGFA